MATIVSKVKIIPIVTDNDVAVSDDNDSNEENDAIGNNDTYGESDTNGDNGTNESPFAPMNRQYFHWRH